jgi:hypothetical protein
MVISSTLSSFHQCFQVFDVNVVSLGTDDEKLHLESLAVDDGGIDLSEMLP